MKSYKKVPMKTFVEETVNRFKAAGVEDPRHETRMMIMVLTELDTLLDDEIELTPGLLNAVEERCARKPFSKIYGDAEFYGRAFRVDENVLDPRPDSEVLIMKALEICPDDAFIIEYGVGSGCLMATMLMEKPGTRGLGVEISQPAAEMALLNMVDYDLEDRFVCVLDDMRTFIPDEKCDLFISNPPYIKSGDIEGLQPEVKDYDPRLALDGGEDGCDFYRAIFANLPKILKPNGHFLLEIAPDICENVQRLATEAGCRDLEILNDLGGRERVLLGRCG